ncbi:MAG: deoxyribose-phosphate aldolase [Nitrososphaerota archaeon]
MGVVRRLEASELAARIDHTNLNPDATVRDIERLCAEARDHGFRAVVVNPIWVPHAVKFLKGMEIRVCATINVPMGGSTTLAKVVEIRNLRAMGCDEVDFMVNVGYLKSGMLEEFRRDVEEQVRAAEGMVTKAILETAVLTEQEVVLGARLCEEAGVDYVKNSTGWGKGGPATVEIIRLLRSSVSPRVRVKASGGIRDAATALALIEAGADLIGTSRGVEIVKGLASMTAERNASSARPK